MACLGPKPIKGLFNLFQMSQQEEDVLSLEDSGSECFDTAEAGSSADEMEDCLSAPPPPPLIQRTGSLPSHQLMSLPPLYQSTRSRYPPATTHP
jgi:hypothetical protein